MSAIDALRLEPLLEAATAQCGISDPADAEIIEPLTRLLDALRNEADLSEQGAQLLQAHMVSLLVMRMRIRDRLRRHPEILAEQIRRPVIILGLPRTGTTKLQRSLAATGHFQTFPLWKILNPLPLPSDAPGTDSRLAVAEQFVAMLQQRIPDFYAGHPLVAAEAEEEALVQELCFVSESPCFLWHVPSYQRWVVARNIESSYRWLESVMQLDQWQSERAIPKRPWLLKSPIHIGRLAEILTVFPDAVLVHCHRDFEQSVPSTAALTAAMRTLYTGKRDNVAAGRLALELFGSGWKANHRARKQLGATTATFIDLPFDEIVTDTAGVAERIFDALDLPFSADARAHVRRWNDDNPPSKHGKFPYDLATYGLTAEQIRQFFAAHD